MMNSQQCTASGKYWDGNKCIDALKKIKKKIKFGITRKEIRKRLGYVLLGFFTFYLVSPVRSIVGNWINGPWIGAAIGITGIIATLYFFEF